MLVEIVFLPINDDPLTGEELELFQFVSLEKQKKLLRYRHYIDKKLSLYADLLVRYLACKHLGLTNDALVFSQTNNGKPYLLGGYLFAFNLSHTRNAIAVAIAKRNVGVDIEKVVNNTNHIDRCKICKEFFTTDEQNYVISEAEGRDWRFYEIWTRKEAYLKWKGEGFSLQVNNFSTLHTGQGVQINAIPVGEYIITVCTEIIIQRYCLYCWTETTAKQRFLNTLSHNAN
ncbi:MAG: 4'-phosphopantetheinyl transferase superfamily protein [Firmicutes bacterium]|nr:4'-phosphopantetheinyl transferase superfamily protein [Bacillota bacterium]